MISGNGGRGLDIFGTGTTGNVVQGNLIGVDKDGTTPLPNDQDGIQIDTSASSNTIGGTAAGAGNVISGNGANGIRLAGAATTANTIHGNVIGLGLDGTTIVPNGASGIDVNFDAGLHTIGGSSAGAGNVISGNTNSGIRAYGITALTIEGNLVGLDSTGTLDRGNGSHGLWVRGTNITIGGATAGHRNVISGNGGNGIWLDSADGAIVEGNRIGTNAAGTAGVANASSGIFSSGSNTLLANNLVSGNGQDGIEISSSSSSVTISGNSIGSDAAGTGALPNGWAGIRFFGSLGTIGGTTLGDGNLIVNNSSAGLFIGSSATDNSILRNSFVANSDIEIDLGLDGVTPNDPGDIDTGANGLLNFPLVTAAVESAGIVAIDFDLDVPADDYRVEVFTSPSGADPTGFGEGESFESASTISHTGSGVESFRVTYTGAAGDIVTLTVTEQSAGPAYGSTSEFSATETVTVANRIATAVAGSDTTYYVTPLVVDPAANDSDPDGDSIDEIDFTQPGDGTVVDNGDGTYTYTPDAFVYRCRQLRVSGHRRRRRACPPLAAHRRRRRCGRVARRNGQWRDDGRGPHGRRVELRRSQRLR